ncbi:hypothetical protein M9Y10_032312 [Tritrichomonas musculus]|uniref:Protein kinase domain-containing protein n=1 Tax=Tritrichomonas musculus TaxID=1915356 RepID=A0ABR2H0J0_9EUKA
MIQTSTQDGYPIVIPISFHGYNLVQYLGCGSTSVVFLIEDENSHELYSAKILAKADIENKNIEISIKNEVQILQSVSHPNIIKVQDFFIIKNQYEQEYYVIIMEYCQNGDLLSYATKHGFTNDSEKKRIIKGFLGAIEYLHNNGISHGDIKTENILLDSNFQPKLCDFGFCKMNRIAGDESKNGTLYYAAPELFVTGSFDTIKADIYAIGITLYALSELQFPFISGNQTFIIQQIMSGCLSIRSGIDEKLLRLVQKCTSMNPQYRPSIEEILNDEYFNCQVDNCQNNFNNQFIGYQIVYANFY